MVETFFKTLLVKLIWRNRWETRRQAEGTIFQSINDPCNLRRRHSSLGAKVPWPFYERPHKCLERPKRKRDKTKYKYPGAVPAVRPKTQ